MSDDPNQDTTRSIAPLAHPTEEMPTYRTVAAYPEAAAAPEPTRPMNPPPSTEAASTGQLPVTGVPVTAPPASGPRGPHLPTVVRGVVILAMAAIVVVWRMVEHPNWPIVGISVGIGVGVVFLLVAAVSAVLHRTRDRFDVDRMLAGR